MKAEEVRENMSEWRLNHALNGIRNDAARGNYSTTFCNINKRVAEQLVELGYSVSLETDGKTTVSWHPPYGPISTCKSTVLDEISASVSKINKPVKVVAHNVDDNYAHLKWGRIYNTDSLRNGMMVQMITENPVTRRQEWSWVEVSYHILRGIKSDTSVENIVRIPIYE